MNIIKNVYIIGIKICKYNLDLNNLPTIQYTNKNYQKLIDLYLFLWFNDGREEYLEFFQYHYNYLLYLDNIKIVKKKPRKRKFHENIKDKIEKYPELKLIIMKEYIKRKRLKEANKIDISLPNNY